MPTSDLRQWPDIIHLVWQLSPQTVLDVGPGRGKGGILIPEYCGEHVVMDAVEMESSYITPKLKAIYRNIINKPAIHVDEDTYAQYDCVLLIDVIEHMTHKEGERLLDKIPVPMVICTPMFFFEQGDGMPESEKHRCVWTSQEFTNTGRMDHDASIPGRVLVRLKGK